MDRPLFDDAQLNSYYKDFYWNIREQHAVYFSNRAAPAWYAQNQLDWVEQHRMKFSTPTDFEALDCAAAYLLVIAGLRAL
jgi:hypothetical protein